MKSISSFPFLFLSFLGLGGFFINLRQVVGHRGVFKAQ